MSRPLHRLFLAVSLIAITATLPTAPLMAQAEAPAGNPLLGTWTTPDGVPPYDRIRPEHYEPAFDAGIAQARANMEKIATSSAAPSFANTIEAMELATPLLSRTQGAFYTVASADATPAISKVQEAVSPKVTRYSSDMMLDQRLFGRVDTLYKARATLGLTPEQLRLLEVTHRRFVRAGAALSPEARTRVAAINEQAARLSVTFGQNLLNDQKASDSFLSAAEMAGLSDGQKAAAAAKAAKAGQPGLFLISASRSDVEPFLTVATNRAAREKVYHAFNRRGDNGNANDNNAIIAQLVALRSERSGLLGFSTHAAYVLDNSMAATPAAAMALLRQVYDPALIRAGEEERDLATLAAKDGITTIQPWDWRFYAEKVRAERYNLDDARLKAYLPLDGMVAALMETTKRLYGISFTPRPDVPVYADGVCVWEVRGADNKPIGLFYADWFARDSKRPGAWMNSIRVQSDLTGFRPIVVNNSNFTPPPAGERATISFDDARTLFHEFGHALHGLFSRVRYPGLSGTAVYRDFVEFPSQLHEHWVEEPEILRAHARNAAGEPIPEALLQSLLNSMTFNQGFATVQQLSSAILDQELHALPALPADFNARQWEAERLAALKVPASIGMRHRLSHFSHLFDGGYDAGYYAYTWAEVMDADGFEAFRETGNAFDPATASRLKTNVLETGNSREPQESYKAFRGRMPTADALLKNRGLK